MDGQTDGWCVCVPVMLVLSSKWDRLNRYCEKILNWESKDSGPTLAEPLPENHDIYLFAYYLSPR